MEILTQLVGTALGTAFNVAPIVVVLVLFQFAVLRRRVPNFKRIAMGFVYVLLGLTLFLVGLEEALFPIGETMAQQLTAQAAADPIAGVRWDDYLLVYAFAGAIGFATTVAPSLRSLPWRSRPRRCPAAPWVPRGCGSRWRRALRWGFRWVACGS